MPALLPANTSPDIRASTLAPKEPYHIPGYAGYRPQFKYQCSETFGASTHRLLTSDSVRKSGNTVLRSIDPPRAQTCTLGFHDVPKLANENYDLAEILSRRRPKWGDHLFRPNMRSGYSGFVPKAHFSSYHSKTYPEICNAALKDFAEDQAACKETLWSLHLAKELQEADNLTSSQRDSISTSRKLPLRAISTSFPPYKSSSAFKPDESPYFLPEEHPRKNFKSGFAGHVPFYKDLGGSGYPVVTNHALKEFSRERGRIFSSENKQIDLRSLTQPQPPKAGLPFSTQATRNRIFLVETGLIPRYAGYVPGQKYRFGHTFGDSTTNPLKIQPVPPASVPALTS